MHRFGRLSKWAAAALLLVFCVFSASAKPRGRMAERDTGPRGNEAVYLMLYTHHYSGKGGYYPTAAELREWVQLLEDAGVADKMTFFFDAILVERIEQEDPAILAHIRSKQYSVGYHGEDAHGPWPAIEGRKVASYSLVKNGMDFGEAVAAIQDRYGHALRGVSFKDDNQIDPNVPGSLDRSAPGGISKVLATFGDVPYVGGTCLSQPAASFAMRGLNPGVRMWQSGGPFADHFLARTGTEDARKSVHAWLGNDTSVFWYMGLPAIRQGSGNTPAKWTGDGARMRAKMAAMPRRVPVALNLSMGEDVESTRAMLAWLKTWMKENPAYQLKTPAEVKAMLVVEAPRLDPKAVAAAVASSWDNGPPDVLSVGKSSVSLADALEVMARAVAAGSGDPVKTTWVNGPFESASAIHNATGTVSASDLKQAAAAWVTAVERSPWRASPASVTVGSTSIGFHQFYRALAAVLSHPESAKITLSSGSPWSPTTKVILDGWPHPHVPDAGGWHGGAFWTSRPAEWK